MDDAATVMVASRARGTLLSGAAAVLASTCDFFVKLLQFCGFDDTLQESDDGIEVVDTKQFHVFSPFPGFVL